MKLLLARIVFSSASCAFIGGCFCRSSAQDFSQAARESDFKTFVQDFEDNYAYLEQPGKPWLTWEDRYDVAVQKASSKEEFDAILASALSELHDFHAEVRSRLPNPWLPFPTFADVVAEFQGPKAVVIAVRQGSDAEHAGVQVGDEVVGVGSSSIEQAIAERLTPAVDQTDLKARKWALLSVVTGRSDEARNLVLKGKDGGLRTVKLPVERHFDRPSSELTSSILPGNIGLIRFNNSLGDQKTVAGFRSGSRGTQVNERVDSRSSGRSKRRQ